MGQEPGKDDRTLYYKESSDYDEAKKTGIKAVDVTNEAQLVEAGVDKDAAKTIMANFRNTYRGEQESGEFVMVVVKSPENQAVRVFAGKRYNGDSFHDIFLKETVDLKHPNETVHMENGINLTLAHIQAQGLGLEQRHVNQIEKAITEKKIAAAPSKDLEVIASAYARGTKAELTQAVPGRPRGSQLEV